MNRSVKRNTPSAELSNRGRLALQRRAELYPRNFVLVDIREGGPGGEFPWSGWIKLRSFHSVLEFVGEGIEHSPEFDVEPRLSTSSSLENPKRTLEILVSRRPRDTHRPSLVLGDRVYSLGPGRWNRQGFRILHQLLQMALSDSRSLRELPVAIAK